MHFLIVCTLFWTVTIAWYVPRGQSRETVLSIDSKKGTASSPVIGQAPSSVVEDPRRGKSILVGRNSGGEDLRKKKKKKLKLKARAAIEDDLTDEELDAFLEENGEDEEEEAAAAAAGARSNAESPTFEEVQQLLTPAERVEVIAAKKEASSYHAVYKIVQKAKKEGREPTAQEKANLKYGRERIAVYRKLRYRGLSRLVKTGNARAEVAAYYEKIVAKKREWVRGRQAQWMEAERRARNEELSVKSREERASQKARRKTLEELVEGGQASKEDEVELAAIYAEQDRKNARNQKWYKNLSPEQRGARNAKRRASRQQQREKKKAVREGTDGEHGRLTEAERQKRKKDEKATSALKSRATQKARMKELEVLVKSPQATKEHEDELAAIYAQRDRKNAGARVTNKKYYDNLSQEQKDAKVAKSKGRRQQERAARKVPDEEPGDSLSDEELDALLDEEEAATTSVEAPTLGEVQEYLTPEERMEFQTAREEAPFYQSARRAALKAKDEGRKLTQEEKKNLDYGRKRLSEYHKLRLRGITRLANSGNARPEVVAYHKKIMSSQSARNLRWYNKLSPEGLAARTAKQKARYQRVKAEREALEARIKGGKADAKDWEEWQKLKDEKAQAKADRETGKARFKELDVKVKNKTANEEEKKEWATIGRKLRKLPPATDNNALVENQHSPQGTTDRSDNQALQTRLKSSLHDLQQAIPNLLSVAKTRSQAQLENFLHKLGQAMPKGVQSQDSGRYPSPGIPIGGGIRAGVPFAG
ncbi:MAG: hypothetical protein M1816_000106 [Peltula sp. TS41687]|nr:MAG: hypothetical protein M1816_000106 [Peltula sp. TS41687]